MVDFLAEVLAHKREELAQRQAREPLAALKERAQGAPPPRDFAAALRGPGLGLIAEIKRASPSKGPLYPDLEPVALARSYAAAGAAAISVLTEERYFQGSLADLEAVRRALPQGPPLLRKDFLFDPYHIHEARAYGADAVLLIAAVLETVGLRHAVPLLRDLMALAATLGMAALVEVHSEGELSRALAADAPVIGINHRDLRTFSVDTSLTRRLLPLIPKDRLVVAESGIRNGAEARKLHAMGVQAILVGEALVTAEDVGAKVRELVGA